MATYVKFNQFIEDVFKGVHNFTSDSTCTVTVALSSVAPVAGNSVLSDLTQISYTNLSSRVVTGVTAEQTGGTLSFTANDLVLTASGAVATFRYVSFYNDDAASDNLMCFFDHGSDVTMANGETYTIDIPTNLFTAS